ncbi:hypothetical protein [Psychrosphaera algicola]|uniref:Uncharacterized protein n=1 Tax=Psychrosphaera algicola TaxID=3023714 RepID=A0ABT5FGL2_9GAMM|nr:hypothetical protein [Psychrosphaera sp. G1-22]MDC2890379.1 hypothetical protein [Psychrosphaera sp. G1-22]
MNTSSFPQDKSLITDDEPKVISNYNGYGHPNSSNWEHDDTGCINNYAGCEDMSLSAEAEHSGWEEGYDY